MAIHTLYGKANLCYTEADDFVNVQPVGKDPVYKRYDSVYSVIDKHFTEEYKHFLAHPIYSDDDGYIQWYVKEWNETPRKFIELSGSDKEKYTAIKERFIAEYNNVRSRLTGEDMMILTNATKFIDDEFIFCYDDTVVVIAWGMTPDQRKHVIKGSVIHALKIPERHKLTFDAGTHGHLLHKVDEIVHKADGSVLSKNDLPAVVADTGYEFIGWTPDHLGKPVNSDMSFTALYEEVQFTMVSLDVICDEYASLSGTTHFEVKKGTRMSQIDLPEVVPYEGYEFKGWSVDPGSELLEDTVVKACVERKLVTCRFYVGMHGTLPSSSEIKLPYGQQFTKSQLPEVAVDDGYKFVGWDGPDEDFVLTDDVTFTAMYEADSPWYKSSWFRWLVRILLFLLLLWLLLWLLKDCSCSSKSQDSERGGGDGLDTEDASWISTDPNVGSGGIYNPENPYEAVPTPPEHNDILPPYQGVLPPIEGTPEVSPDNPGIFADRLNILMENADKSIMDLAREFKNRYPGDEYQVIYYDDVVKRMQVIVPESEKDRLKQEIPSAFAPEYQLFVFDESLFNALYAPEDPMISDRDASWYLDAVNAFEGWDITTGDESVVVAVIDNGFDLTHPELKNNAIVPYNVWSHDSNVFPLDEDHGTHIAGTALAAMNNAEGICGIAPKCKFIPVQVADANNLMTTTSVLDGVLYALYQGADVVNISLAHDYSIFADYSSDFQKNLIRNSFKEEERLWREVARIAATHKATLVLAAGNENMLAGIGPIQRPDNFIIVSAVDHSLSHLHRPEFSNYGEYSTVSAPGVDIFSCVKGNDYMSGDGTSCSAPIVTGTVALMKSLDKDLTSLQIKTILQETGLHVNGNVGPMIQIDKALQRVVDRDYSVTPVQPSSGDVQILLSWDNYNDLDLMCTDPSGEMVWYKNKVSQSGGKLEIDMNVECPGSRTPIENIFWPVGGAPEGTYNVYVKYFRQHESDADTPYSVKVRHGSKEDTYTGLLKNVSDVVQICSFTIGNPSPSSGRSPSVSPSPVPEAPQSNNSEVERLERERARLRNELDRVENELNQIRNIRG